MKPLQSLDSRLVDASSGHQNGNSVRGNPNILEYNINNASIRSQVFLSEFNINDLPEAVRNFLSKKVTLEEVSCSSGATVKVAGSYIPPEEKDISGLESLHLKIQASKKQNIDRAAQRIRVLVQHAMNLPKYKEKVLIGLEMAPPSFDVRGKVLGPGGANLQYITNETGAIVTLRGRGSGFIEPTTGLESIEPLHLCVENNKYDILQAGRQLAFNLIETVQQEWYNYQQQHQPPAPSSMHSSQPSSQSNLGRSERRRHFEAEQFGSDHKMGRLRQEPSSFMKAADQSGRRNIRGYDESGRKGEMNERKRKHWSDAGDDLVEAAKFSWSRTSRQPSKEKERESYADSYGKRNADWRNKEIAGESRKDKTLKRDYNQFKDESFKNPKWIALDIHGKFNKNETSWVIGRDFEQKEKEWPEKRQRKFESPSKDIFRSKLPPKEEFERVNFRERDVASYSANLRRDEEGRSTKGFRENFPPQSFINEKVTGNYDENYLSDDELDYEDDEEDKWRSKSNNRSNQRSPPPSRMFQREKSYDKVHYEHSERYSKVPHEPNFMKKDYQSRRSSSPYRRSPQETFHVNDPFNKRLDYDDYRQRDKYYNESSKNSFGDGVPRVSSLHSDYKADYSRQSPVPSSKLKYERRSFERLSPTYDIDRPSSSYLNEGNAFKKGSFEVSRSRRSRSRSSNERSKKHQRYKVAVMSDKVKKLTAEDVDTIIDSIKEANARGNKFFEFEFIGRESKNYIFVVDPISLEGMQWLLSIESLSSPYGRKYTLFPYDDMFNSYKVKTYVFNDLVPRGAASIKGREVLRELEKSNEGLQTDLWKIRKENLESRGLFLLMALDKLSMIFLKNINWRPIFLKSKLIIRPVSSKEADPGSRFEERKTK